MNPPLQMVPTSRISLTHSTCSVPEAGSLPFVRTDPAKPRSYAPQSRRWVERGKNCPRYTRGSRNNVRTVLLTATQPV